MKKILRYLLGSKGSSPTPENRPLPAHVLAVKAVMRRRRGENKNSEAQTPATVELPVAAEQLSSVDRQVFGAGPGETPPLRSQKQRRIERTLRRRHQDLVAEQVASVIAPGGGETPPLRSKKKRRIERTQRRRQQGLVAEKVASAGREAIGPSE